MLHDLFGLVNTGVNVYNAYTGKRVADTFQGPGHPSQEMPEHPAVTHLRMVFALHQVGLLTDEEANAKADLIRPHLPPWQGGSYQNTPK